MTQSGHCLCNAACLLLGGKSPRNWVRPKHKTPDPEQNLPNVLGQSRRSLADRGTRTERLCFNHNLRRRPMLVVFSRAKGS